jgi:hypothetical protein
MWACFGVTSMCVRVMICYCEDDTFVYAPLRNTREAVNGQPKKLRCKTSSPATVRVVQQKIRLRMHGGGPASRWRRRLRSLGFVPSDESDSCRTCQVFMGPRWFAEKAATRKPHAVSWSFLT